LQGLQSSRYGFVQAICGHVNCVRSALVIVEADAAVSLSHRESLPQDIRPIFARS
jgi:hypothetical protein